MEYLRIKNDIASINPETIFTIYGYPVANSTLMIFLIMGIIIVAAFLLKRRLSLAPGTFQNVLETVYETMLALVTQITRSKERAAEIFPLIGTLFVYIAVANFLGLIPGVSSVTYYGKQVFRTATSDFNTTFGLALAMVLLIQLASIREWGFFTYLGRFVQVGPVIRGFREGIRQGAMAVINFFIGLLDIVSEVAKVVSLSLRLFGNMYAGEVLMTVIFGGIAYVVPAMWLAMSMLTAIVQTVVFGSLVAAFYVVAVRPDEEPVTIASASEDMDLEIIS
jgi:F-type H+-transporting ATPase subunit a